MADATNSPAPSAAPGVMAPPPSTSRPLSSTHNRNSHPYNPAPPGSGYGPYVPPPSHMSNSPNNYNAPPPYQMYPPYPHANGNYPPQNPGPDSPAEGASAPQHPPHYMYHPMHHPYNMPPPNWNGHQHPGGPEGYGWGAPPLNARTNANGSESLPKDENAKAGDESKAEETEHKGESSEPVNSNESDDHGMPPPSYYHPYPPYGMPPPAYHNSENPADAPPHQYGYGPPPPHHPYPSSEMGPFPYPPMPGAYPPYHSQESQSPWNADSKKRPRPAFENPYAPYQPPNKRHMAHPQGQWVPPQRASSQFTTTKSVRRKKKMYSDYVGVTYNKTHAKYQACITHYRKQHYLGRYKLAVDAALAYDESARLLKGSSWKVNFPTRQAYEVAKIHELERHGAAGGKAIDLERSMATVTSKIEEIATKSGNTTTQSLVVRPHSRLSFGPTLPAAGPRYVVTTDGKSKHAHFPPMPQMMAHGTPSMYQVTSSLSGMDETPHEDNPQQQAEMEDDTTPLPETPNPTRHVMGSDPTTPDSVIKPTALSYLKRGQRVEVLTGNQYSTTKEANISTTEAKPPARAMWQASSTSKLPPTTPKVGVVQRDVLTSPRPVIQNGTLAAASALMTLFGNSPKNKS